PAEAVEVLVEAGAQAAARVEAPAVVDDAAAPPFGHAGEPVAKVELDRAVTEHLVGQAIAVDVDQVELGLGLARAHVRAEAERGHVHALLGALRRPLAAADDLALVVADGDGDVAGEVGARADALVL